ncbi:unnamed protein product [Clonostachys rosea]|uniref:NFACT RNA-binding domain-containing protein n=1 Tax=Bionectria ochroleuca TaxID=29856 RepID=A0ABY6UTE2_BIOOC|nr:unnamed protein product [Clonostachys rosea]
MKQRFSSLDVKVIAHELQESLVTLRLANIYDLSSKILLFKFSKPDNKKQLLIDTGFRCHLTDFARTTAAAPSVFVARLRKVLKTRRLTKVSQIGTDRVLEFQFSDGQYRLFLEFFASGNLILTDAELKILAISRNVSEADGQEPQRIGLQYSLENRQNYPTIPPLTKERVKNALTTAVSKAAAQNPSALKKGKTKVGAELRKSLAGAITEVPPVLVDHTLQANSFDLSKPLADILASETLLDDLMKSLSEARDLVESIISTSQCKGYIFAKYRVASSNAEEVDDRRENLLYEDFHPFCPKKFQEDPAIKVIEFDGFNQTVDEFFSSLEGQKLESRLSEREAQAKRRLESARQEQAKRIEGLQEVQNVNLRKAAAIEANVEWVQEAMDAVNGLLAQGMDWVNIGKLIEREKKRSNPVAQVIKLPLKLDENVITLVLAEEEFEPEEDEDPFETDSESEDNDTASSKAGGQTPGKSLSIDINLGLSPWSNAREYYDQRKTAAVKEERTQQQATRALKNTEQRIHEDLKKGLKQEKALLQPIRQLMWFEKFIWFISSDGYLVIGGKDALQNEMLYKRHLRKGDVYCHADLRGASSVIIKNNLNTPDAPIPPATLSQAGTLSVCSSEAWDSKAGMGAWWVNAEQVSKSASTGEILPPGSFTIKGNKNFLPPAQLLMGLGFMFKISDSSKARHVKHRVHDTAASVGSSTENDNEADEEEQDDDLSTAKTLNAQEDKEEESEQEQDEAEDEDQDKRDNPLQQHSEADEADNTVAQVEEEVSDLKLTEQAADEAESEEESPEQKPDDEEDLASTSEAPSRSSTRGNDAAPAKKAPAKRGQKGKAKKIAAKYKYQDEEDRAAAEAVLGAALGKKRAEAEAKAKEDREAELEAMRERRRAQHQKQQKEAAKHEEVRRQMMDEGVDLPDEGEEEKLASIDSLVGTPLPGDEIAEVIPVCAPWNALGKFKYKVKLQPGAQKKGKAVKEILERLKIDSGKKNVVDEHARDSERMWPREVELIKALKPEEVVNSVPVGKVRVMMSGGGSGGSGGGGKGSGGGKGGGRGGGGKGRSGKGSKK